MIKQGKGLYELRSAFLLGLSLALTVSCSEQAPLSDDVLRPVRIAIVQDLQKNIPHAVLVVYTDQGSMILDNQIKTAIDSNRVSHYKPIFSINQNAWWLHTAPKGNVTVVASAAR